MVQGFTGQIKSSAPECGVSKGNTTCECAARTCIAGYFETEVISVMQGMVIEFSFGVAKTSLDWMYLNDPSIRAKVYL